MLKRGRKPKGFYKISRATGLSLGRVGDFILRLMKRINEIQGGNHEVTK